MRILLLFLAGICLCGCKPAKWEYRTIEVHNVNNNMFLNSRLPPEEMMRRDQRANSEPGHFLEFGTNGFDVFMDNADNPVELHEYGVQGWELVAAVPETHTVPDAGSSGRQFANIRTGKIRLIFTRPY